MKVKQALLWDEYELLDSGDGRRLERFGAYTLVRPDPQTIWLPTLPESDWNGANAVFENRDGQREGWHIQNMPDSWHVSYKDLKLNLRLSPFKHTGVFPEQTVQWEWIDDTIKRAGREVRVLNLFAYTGVSTLVAARAGAQVTHVDASKPTIAWAKENQRSSRLEQKPIRWILDDALKFAAREARRGKKYDAIIMDPPAYGHGPDGEPWDFMEDFPSLIETSRLLLSDEPLFILVNAYAVSASSIMLENILKDVREDYGGTVEAGELVISQKNSERLLSTGIYGSLSWK